MGLLGVFELRQGQFGQSDSYCWAPGLGYYEKILGFVAAVHFWWTGCFALLGRKGINRLSKLKNDLDIDFKKRMKSKHQECFHKDENCSSKIIKAHSIQNNRILNKISVDGKVLMIAPERQKDGLHFKMDATGRKVATTFSGFCGKHDTKLFHPIESCDYEPGNKQQEYLFAYRALAREHNAKWRIKKVFENSLSEVQEQLKSEKSEGMKSFYLNSLIYNHSFLEGVMITLSKMEKMRVEFNKSLAQKKYQKIVTHNLEFNSEFPLAVASCFSMGKNFKGKEISNFISGDSKPTFLTIFPQTGKTYVIFSYLDRHKDIFVFFKKEVSKLNIEEQKILITNMILCYTENFVLSSSYWDSFSSEEQETMIKLFKGTTFAGELNINKLTPINMFK